MVCRLAVYDRVFTFKFWQGGIGSDSLAILFRSDIQSIFGAVMVARKHYTTVSEYIADFPDDVQIVLKKLRTTIRKVVPEADEVISYNIPTFKLNGKYVIYFAGFEHHVSLYPITDGTRKKFGKELAPYLSGKGTAKFPLDKPLPLGLIAKIVKYKLKERLSKQ